MTLDLSTFLATHHPELIHLRRHLHAHPELGKAERQTTALVARRLEAVGLRPRLLSTGTGLICDIGDGDEPMTEGTATALLERIVADQRRILAEVTGRDLARLTVRFLAEFRSRSKGPEGEAVDDRRTAELWTFERNLSSRDPNWTLHHVDAAEA